MPIQTPTSWTSTGLDWTAADPMWPLELLNPCTIESIKEKDSATSRTVPVLLSDPYNPIRPNWDYVSAIHAEVTALIPLFVNHLLPTATPGNYNGETTIPMFTEATILTAIGDSGRIVPTHLSTLSAWYFQTRKILDMMRWGRNAINPIIYRSKTSDWQPDWASALSVFISTPWTNSGSAVVRHNAGYSTGVGKYVNRNSVKVSYSNTTAYNIACDLYNVATKDIAIYENNDFPLAIEKKLFNFLTAEISANNNYDFIVGDTNTVTITEPMASGSNKGWDTGMIFTLIKKFDGPNGFKFKAASSPST